jgi:predicted DNA-binding protein (UPF0251 family)
VTLERFLVIARLIRMRGGRSQEAARLVLVEGLRPSEAARKTGLSPQGVCDAVRRVKRADEQLRNLDQKPTR